MNSILILMKGKQVLWVILFGFIFCNYLTDNNTTSFCLILYCLHIFLILSQKDSGVG